MNDTTQVLAGLLANLPPALGTELGALAVRREVADRTVIVRDGEVFGTVGYLLEGALGMQKTMPDGRLHVVGLLLPHDMYGRLFDGPSTYDLVALAPSRLIEFERLRFEDFVSRHPEAQNLLMTRILDELDTAREWLLLMSGHRVTERVAAFLLVLFRRSVQRRPGTAAQCLRARLDIPIRRADLAHYLGTRPESLSRALHDLEREGTIRLIDANSFEVANVKALVDAAGSDLLMGGPES